MSVDDSTQVGCEVMSSQREEERKKEKNTNKNTMKNIRANPRISMNTEIMSGRIIRKINEIGRKTHALKRKQNAFYAEALKEARRSTEFPGTDKLREMTYDKFEQEWKEIDDGKDEVDWLIHRLYISIEGEEEYQKKKNEVVFYAEWNPECHVCATGEWRVNTAGEVVGDVDTYFYRLRDGQRCEHVRDTLPGWPVSNKKTAEDWETLFQRIEDIPDIKKTICTERSVMMCEKAGVGVSPTPENEKYEKAMCKECKKMDG